ncbi:MAG: radical SAM protein, partial [Verrucomicrobiales bacterium]
MVAPRHAPLLEQDPFAIRPYLVFWEVTRACALACQHCRAEAQPRRHPTELTDGEAITLIDQLADLAPPMLILTGGDPLMRRDILKIARHATHAGMRVGLSPAGTNRLTHCDFDAI